MINHMSFMRWLTPFFRLTIEASNIRQREKTFVIRKLAKVFFACVGALRILAAVFCHGVGLRSRMMVIDYAFNCIVLGIVLACLAIIDALKFQCIHVLEFEECISINHDSLHKSG